jgi:signal transduction histidine kinase
MPAWPRRGVLGLRGRIVGALLVTTVATLGIAAVALLGPLEQELRSAAVRTLHNDVRGATSTFRKLELSAIADPSRSGVTERRALDVQQQALAVRLRIAPTNVNLLGFPDVSGQGNVLYIPPHDAAAVLGDPYDDATTAFLTGRTVQSFGSVDGTDVARVALPVTIDSQRYVLAVRRPIEEIPGAVRVVRTAFITAALAGVGLTLILGIALAATLVRRLRRLRQAALHLASGGTPEPLPADRARDEVGDLTRTFTIMQQRLQHQEEARRAFVATASHELRTPLTSLDGMLELLDDDLRGGNPDLGDAQQLLERARAQSRRLGRLAADLLDLSRLDADVALRSEPIELGELSRAVMAEFELGTSERRITPVLDDPGAPIWALGDPGSVARIVRILLDNALRASPEGAEITVALRGGDTAELSVQDAGPGVPPQERELIFERFQRGMARGTEAGFGLGLAIGRELAERMGGELVLAERDRPGARFTLRMRAARAPHEAAALRAN